MLKLRYTLRLTVFKQTFQYFLNLFIEEIFIICETEILQFYYYSLIPGSEHLEVFLYVPALMSTALSSSVFSVCLSVGLSVYLSVSLWGRVSARPIERRIIFPRVSDVIASQSAACGRKQHQKQRQTGSLDGKGQAPSLPSR